MTAVFLCMLKSMLEIRKPSGNNKAWELKLNEDDCVKLLEVVNHYTELRHQVDDLQAQVASFERYRELVRSDIAEKCWVKENQNLKGLLKECLMPLEMYHAYGWSDRNGVINMVKDCLEVKDA